MTSEDIEVANKFELKQNYPNPFNPSTAIEYTIEGKNYVTLKVYDMLGKEVVTLVSAEQEPGSYIVTWDARNYGSGTYFYRLTSGNFVETRRMVLNK
jgi:flagellar hook assembly protein FlgD